MNTTQPPNAPPADQAQPTPSDRAGLPDRYLTPEDIAEMFGVPKETVYGWRKKHTGPPGFRVGRHIRYDPTAVHAWAAQRMATDAAA
ncbi:helix-turn-helix domain-containing protein [Streptomyces polygonati]|uniref:Helix-turn-helix domain-containing protein n=1 Tax=Streptomyces polygonati TaxID=1617087 RepID=A0ABV8I036_9ACTN